MLGRSITLQLDKYQFLPQEAITGKVILNISKPVKAKSLFVRFVVLEKTSRNRVGGLGAGRSGNRGIGVSAGGSTARSTREIFRFDLPLDGEREYSRNEEFPFTMQIPQEALPNDMQNMQQMGGVLGKGLGILASMSPLGNTTRVYKLQARLKVPWGIDTKASTDITIQV